MNILVLRPGQQRLAFNYFSNGWDKPICAGHMEDYRTGEGSQDALTEMTEQIARAADARNVSRHPDVIALRGIFGGAAFREPALVSPRVMRKLEKLVPNAPLHIPALLALIRSCEAACKNTPIVLVFETAFFVDLPERERLYAIDPKLAGASGARRFGYHGILHAAACQHAARRRRELGLTTPARILSICLEARPEVAAVLGHNPVLVTSGATPLEGLPGQTTSGELDPSIVLMLAQKKGWGPEQINAVLTRQSGWLGLVGRNTTLAEIFGSGRPECELARQVIQYRLLQVCGAGMAALGGVDALVFSGRCAAVGVSLGLWLKNKLDFLAQGSRNPMTVEIFQESIDRVLAETAALARSKASQHQ
jgi:acetate kinase